MDVSVKLKLSLLPIKGSVRAQDIQRTRESIIGGHINGPKVQLTEDSTNGRFSEAEIQRSDDSTD